MRLGEGDGKLVCNYSCFIGNEVIEGLVVMEYPYYEKMSCMYRRSASTFGTRCT